MQIYKSLRLADNVFSEFIMLAVFSVMLLFGIFSAIYVFGTPSLSLSERDVFIDYCSDPFFCNLLLPIYNAATDRKRLLKDNKGKSGIYCFTNLINGKKYIGSSNHLRRRFQEYFNTYYLEKNKNMLLIGLY
uniref:GIY-YIG domain-containing protein n=1 Tax=Morchella importuna TaxID=1174673 RepID=A0A650AF60_9PEZI|nr:hypothetical protein [Morchella importuna]QGN66662.1 hypothetical protein [Morchella importuna]